MKEGLGMGSFKNLLVQTSLVAIYCWLVGFSFIYCIWGKTIIAAMPLAKNSLLINITLHLSCQNYLHVTSVTSS